MAKQVVCESTINTTSVTTEKQHRQLQFSRVEFVKIGFNRQEKLMFHRTFKLWIMTFQNHRNVFR